MLKIAPHPDQHTLMARLTAVGAGLDVAFNGAAGANVLVFPDNLRSGSLFEVDNDVIWPAA